VRSERAHRSSDHRDDFEPGVAALRLTPRALDCDDPCSVGLTKMIWPKTPFAEKAPLLTPPGKCGTAHQWSA
jgi:hypothetical protein